MLSEAGQLQELHDGSGEEGKCCGAMHSPMPAPPSCHNSGMGGNTIVWNSGQSQWAKDSTTKDTVRFLAWPNLREEISLT